MRLLHARPDLFSNRDGVGGKARNAQPCHLRSRGRSRHAGPQRGTRTYEWQPVPLRSLQRNCGCNLRSLHGGRMNSFTFARAEHADDALRLSKPEGAKYLGGGTNLVDLMRETIERPDSLVDVTGLSTAIEDTPEGG